MQSALDKVFNHNSFKISFLFKLITLIETTRSIDKLKFGKLCWLFLQTNKNYIKNK